jgi:hypothetical protein
MGRLVPATPASLPPAPPNRQQIMDHFTSWRERLLEHGQSNCVLTRVEIMRELDRWLDALSDLRGR